MNWGKAIALAPAIVDWRKRRRETVGLFGLFLEGFMEWSELAVFMNEVDRMREQGRGQGKVVLAQSRGGAEGAGVYALLVRLVFLRLLLGRPLIGAD